MNAIEIKQLSFGYDKGLVLKDVAATIKKGSVTCLLGNNGSGKTTLLDCALGVHRKYDGQVNVFQHNIKEMKIKDKAKYMSYIPQKHEESFPYTVEEIVLMGRNPYIRTGARVLENEKKLVDQALIAMDIGKLKHRIYSQLSGGEMQMVLFARAYIQDTNIIIMDEPTASLDLKNERLMLRNIQKLVLENEKTIFMSSHSLNHPFLLHHLGVDVNVIMLKEGRVLFSGKVDEVVNERGVLETYGVHTKVLHYEEGNIRGSAIVTL